MATSIKGVPVLTIALLCIVSINIQANGYLIASSNAIYNPTGITVGNGSPTTAFVIPATVSSMNDSSTNSGNVCQNRIDTCGDYGRDMCTGKEYEAWAKYHCALYCGFCTPNKSGLIPHDCIDKIPNCEEFDDGSLCTAASYHSWARENCRGYCKLDQCNVTSCEDQAGIDCSALDIALNICNDAQKAKLVCRNFCGLCDLVDGQWSLWSSWGECDVSCGNGSHTRRRQCKNPTPAHGGLNCQGNDRNTQSCTKTPCPVHGNWGSWSEWGTCSVTCGQGLRRRDRYCNNPYPSRQGDHCFGNPIDFRLCTQATCFGNWSTWSVWSPCSSKRRGLTFRDRNCTTTMPVNQGGQCNGSRSETTPCNGAVRLIGGTHVSNGRLEIFHNGTWGTVCADSFTNTSAKVVCNMLSYPSSGAHFKTESFSFPPNKIWLDDVVCSGNESNIDECSHSSWGSNNCGHGKDVSIYCSQLHKTPVRLIGGMHNGRLEVSHNGQWGTVCDDSFTKNAAKVICRMLNYGLDNAYYTSHNSTNPPTTIWLDSTSCSGTESDIDDCSHQAWGSNDCSHTEDVYVYCPPPTPHAFTATSPTSSHAQNSLAFSTIVSSVGNDYNSNTGTFTCSSRGQYYFGVSFTKGSAYGSHFVHCFLRLNGANMILINVNSGSYSASVSVTFDLAVGDKVDIAYCSGANYLESSTSVFTGYQIHLD